MSLFFNDDRSIQASYETKPDTEKGGLDTALVGKNLWSSIGQPETDRIALCIQPLQEVPQQESSFICWAKYDEEVCKFILRVLV